jgi:enoyl-CoA hydratase/carnithine racemase
MPAYEYEKLHVRREGRVLYAAIDNPPINLMTLELYRELVAFSAEVAADESVRVVVLESRDPEFFVAHFDVEVLLGLDTSAPATRESELNPFHQMCERFRTMPKATIAKIGGRVGGGGSELALSCDMRFGALGRTVVNQMEVALGILPGGTGTQRLPRLVGRGRALEIILGSDDLDAATAERWGYLDRALPPAELDGFVDRLARRIAGFPGEAIALAKQAVDHALPSPLAGLQEEAFLFQQLLRTEAARERMRRFLELGGQTRGGELRVAELCEAIGTSLAG